MSRACDGSRGSLFLSLYTGMWLLWWRRLHYSCLWSCANLGSASLPFLICSIKEPSRAEVILKILLCLSRSDQRGATVHWRASGKGRFTAHWAELLKCWGLSACFWMRAAHSTPKTTITRSLYACVTRVCSLHLIVTAPLLHANKAAWIWGCDGGIRIVHMLS